MKIGVDIPTDRHGWTALIIIILVVIFLIAVGENSVDPAQGWVYLLLGVPYVLYNSFVTSRHYTIDETGITAHYWGIYHLHRSWDYFGDVGVYTVHHPAESHILLIVFSKKQFAKYNRMRFLSRFELFPFSTFYIVYTPERFEEIKKLCPKITYRTDERKQNYSLLNPTGKTQRRRKKTED